MLLSMPCTVTLEVHTHIEWPLCAASLFVVATASGAHLCLERSLWGLPLWGAEWSAGLLAERRSYALADIFGHTGSSTELTVVLRATSVRIGLPEARMRTLGRILEGRRLGRNHEEP